MATIDEVQALYISYYGRPGDPDGVAFWLDYFANTENVDQALVVFGESDEYVDNYGGLSTTDLINGLYQQLFNRDADPVGLTFYSNLYASGSASLASIALDIANGAQGGDVTTLNNKVAVATAYTAEVTASDGLYGDLDIATAQALLAAVDGSDDSVTAGLAAVEAAVAANEGATGLSGVVQDGYVAGATVFIDLDGDGVQGPNDPVTTTDENGNFTFPNGTDSSGSIIASGGTDISTGLPFEGQYTAPAGSTVVSPLTTLVEKVATETNTTPEQAAATVSASLGLDESIDLLTYDPVAEALDPTASEAEVAIALEAQAAAAQVNTLVSQTGALLAGSGVGETLDDEGNVIEGSAVTEGEGIDAGFDALVAAILKTDETTGTTTPVDLTSTATLEQVVADAADLAGATDEQQAAVEALAPDAAATTSALNVAVDDAVAAAAGDPEAALIGIAQVQVVAEDIEDIVEVGSATGDIGAAIDATVDTVLEAAIIEAATEVGNVVPEPEPEPAPPPPPPIPTLYVVVEGDGAFIDADGDGIMDEGEPVPWNPETQSLADNKVVIRFNDSPGEGEGLNLDGFGSNDRIIIDADTFLENRGYSLSSYLPFTNATTSSYAISSSEENRTEINYQGANFGYTVSNQGGRAADSSLELRLTFQSFSYSYSDHSTEISEQLAVWTAPISITRNQLNFIGLAGTEFASAGTLVQHVVVEEGGAFVDKNRNGVKDGSDSTAWTNGSLADDNVAIRFNGVPGTAIDLTGFNGGDQIDINLAQMRGGTEFAAAGWLPSSGSTDTSSANGSTSAYISKSISTASYSNSSTWTVYLGNYDYGSIEPQTYALRILYSTVASGSVEIPLAQISVQDLADPTSATQVLVTSSNAFVDLNGDGDWDSQAVDDDAAEPLWNGSSLKGNAVTIRFDEVPDSPITLRGFSSDDQILIAVPAIFQDLTDTDNPKFSGLSTPQSNAETVFNSFSVQVGESTFLPAGFTVGLRTPSSEANFYVSAFDHPTYNSGNLAVGVAVEGEGATSSYLAYFTGQNDITRNDISFTDLAPVNQVVVPHNGVPFRDFNFDGIKNGSDTDVGLNLDLSLSDVPYIIHIEGIPSGEGGLNFTGFSEGDRIEIDVDDLSQVIFGNSYQLKMGSFIVPGSNTAILVNDAAGIGIERSNNSAPFVISGALAPVGEAEPVGFTIGSIAQSGSQSFFGAVQFVDINYQVVVGIEVEGEFGAPATYIDANNDHIFSSSIDAPFEGEGFGGANIDFYQAFPVTVHFDAVPEFPLDLTGFGADDSIEIDVDPFFITNFAGGLHGGIALPALLTTKQELPFFLDKYFATSSGPTRTNLGVSYEWTDPFSGTLAAYWSTKTKGPGGGFSTPLATGFQLGSGQPVFLFA